MPRDRSRSRDRERDRDYDRDRDRDRRYRDSSRDRDRERERRSPPRSRSRSPDRKRRRDRDRDDSDDERRARRKREEKEAKRAEKERRREEKRKAAEEEAREIAELSMYSATDNPFNDANLNSQFKWAKKAEKERKQGLSSAEAARRDAERRAEAKEELDRLNKRRAEREVELALREEEEARMQRLSESAQMAEWIAKEDDFHLEQARKRAAIRSRENRAKPIDFLALNLKFANPPPEGQEDDEELEKAGLEVDLDEPHKILENITLEETEELHADIRMYLDLEKNESNLDFWRAMLVVCEDKLDTQRAQRRGGYTAAEASVQAEINALLGGKNYAQLVALQQNVQAKLGSGEPVDVDYWEGLLRSLLVWKARAKLSDMHAVVLQNRLEQLRRRQRDEALRAQAELEAAVARGEPAPGAGPSTSGWGGDMRAEGAAAAEEEEAAMEVERETREEDMPEPYERAMSPVPMERGALAYEDRQLDVVDELEDLIKLFALRRKVTSSSFVAKSSLPSSQIARAPDELGASVSDLAAEALFKAQEASRDIEDEDEEFLEGEDTFIETQTAGAATYTWEDKYRPRKPRYFNRVHTGYEWNKYNQTHYDSDNPPPKVVQGYKFNIFYPDLIDKSKAPTYKIVKDKDNPDIATIYFIAGPPYEDIAFTIVNKQWEYSHKRGFRSSFDRGVLQLWFNFRRTFYRK